MGSDDVVDVQLTAGSALCDLDQSEHPEAGCALGPRAISLGAMHRTGEVDVGPGRAPNETLEEERPEDGSAVGHGHVDVDQVRTSALKEPGETTIRRHGPDEFAGGAGGRLHDQIDRGVVGPQASVVDATPHHLGAGEGRQVDDDVGVEVFGVVDAVPENQSALGIGIGHLDPQTVPHADDVSGVVGAAADRVDGRADDEVNLDVQLELGNGKRRTQNRRRAALVDEHVCLTHRWLEREPTRVVAQALADEDDLGLGRAVARSVAEVDEAGFVFRTTTDSHDAAHGTCSTFHLGQVHDPDDLEAAFGSGTHLANALRHQLRGQLVGREVGHLTRVNDRIAEDGRPLDRMHARRCGLVPKTGDVHLVDLSARRFSLLGRRLAGGEVVGRGAKSDQGVQHCEIRKDRHVTRAKRRNDRNLTEPFGGCMSGRVRAVASQTEGTELLGRSETHDHDPAAAGVEGQDLVALAGEDTALDGR